MVLNVRHFKWFSLHQLWHIISQVQFGSVGMPNDHSVDHHSSTHHNVLSVVSEFGIIWWNGFDVSK